MKIFIDLDDVLFDTRKFMSVWTKAFSEAGISEEVFWKHYHDTRPYEPRQHIKKIKIDSEFNDKKLINTLDRIIVDTKKYIFKDAEKFLRDFSREDLYLVSYGNKEFQNLKIKNSGIEKYFTKILVGDNKKSTSLQKVVRRNDDRRKKHYFLDDRTSHIEDVKKSHPFINTILVQRVGGMHKYKKNKYCDFEIKKLSEAQKIIRQQ